VPSVVNVRATCSVADARSPSGQRRHRRLSVRYTQGQDSDHAGRKRRMRRTRRLRRQALSNSLCFALGLLGSFQGALFGGKPVMGRTTGTGGRQPDRLCGLNHSGYRCLVDGDRR
jgi:hypothetical protein